MESRPRKPSASPDVEAVLESLLSRARILVEEGVTPRRPLEQCLRALRAVLSFIKSQPLLAAEPAFHPSARRAVARIAQELGAASLDPGQPALSVPLPLSVEHEEAIRTGVLLLCAFRAAVERSDPPQKIAAEFGIGDGLKSRDGAEVAGAIARFLAAAVRYPEALAAAKITGRQLSGLAAQERVLRAHLIQRQQQAVMPGLPQRQLILHLALEHFFDRFEAALGARLWDQPAYRSCRLTDSGRLIF